MVFFIFFSYTDFFPKIQIFLIIYTDFGLDQSGRSGFDCLSSQVLNWCYSSGWLFFLPPLVIYTLLRHALGCLDQVTCKEKNIPNYLYGSIRPRKEFGYPKRKGFILQLIIIKQSKTYWTFWVHWNHEWWHMSVRKMKSPYLNRSPLDSGILTITLLVWSS